MRTCDRPTNIMCRLMNESSTEITSSALLSKMRFLRRRGASGGRWTVGGGRWAVGARLFATHGKGHSAAVPVHWMHVLLMYTMKLHETTIEMTIERMPQAKRTCSCMRHGHEAGGIGDLGQALVGCRSLFLAFKL